MTSENSPHVQLSELIHVVVDEKGMTANEALTVASSALSAGNAALAEKIYLELVDQVPALIGTYKVLLPHLYRQGRYGEMEAVSRTCLRHHPEWVDGYFALSGALRLQRKQLDAEEILLRAISIHPDNGPLHNELGLIQKELGRLEQALSSFERCLDINPDISEAYWNKVDISSSISEKELDGLIKRAEDIRLPKLAKAYLYYTISRGFEQREEYDKSFYYLAKGARNKRETLHYIHEKEIEEYYKITQIYDKKLLSKNNTENSASCIPIFICGLPRSGTTLVEQIISSHPSVTAGEELFELAEATKRVIETKDIKKAYPDWVPEFTTLDWQLVGEQYLSLTAPLHGKTHFTDKMPLNYKAIGLIHLALPQAKIVHCLRHPLDNLVGCYRQLFSGGARFSYDLQELADTYIAYRRVMDHWEKCLPNKILNVSYEDIVFDQKHTTKKILDFIGLDWSPSCLEFHSNNRIIGTASNAQVRQPIFSTAVGSWKRYEPFIDPLVFRLKDYLPIP